MVARIHAPTGTVQAARRRAPPVAEDWLVERLWRGELVSISRPEELPREAVASREQSHLVGRLFDPRRCRPPRGPGDLRARRRLRPAAAPLDGDARRAPAAAVGNPGVGDAARPARDRTARERDGDRAAQRPARSGQRLPEGRDQEPPRLRRHRRRKRVAASRAGAAVAGGADQLERVAARTDGHRQGAVRARAARAQPASRPPAGAGQLRGVAAVARRKRAVRAREGRLHRRGRRCGRGGSSSPTAGRFSSTRSAICRPTSR